MLNNNASTVLDCFFTMGRTHFMIYAHDTCPPPVYRIYPQKLSHELLPTGQ